MSGKIHVHGTDERRKDLRVPLRVMHVKLEGKTKVFFGYADNLSENGMFIQSINPKEAGSRFKISFQLPGSTSTIECMAEVIWKRDFSPSSSHKPGMGLKFIDMDSDYKDALRRFLEDKSQSG